MDVLIPCLPAPVSDSMIDDVGFSLEVSAERRLSQSDVESFAQPVAVFANATLARDPHVVKTLVDIDDDVLLVSVFVTGAGAHDESIAQLAQAWLTDVWDAVHAGAMPGAERLRTPFQLLVLARALRQVAWVEALDLAASTSPATEAPR